MNSTCIQQSGNITYMDKIIDSKLNLSSTLCIASFPPSVTLLSTLLSFVIPGIIIVCSNTGNIHAAWIMLRNKKNQAILRHHDLRDSNMQTRSTSLSNITTVIKNNFICTILCSINTKAKNVNSWFFIQRKKSTVFNANISMYG